MKCKIYKRIVVICSCIILIVSLPYYSKQQNIVDSKKIAYLKMENTKNKYIEELKNIEIINYDERKLIEKSISEMEGYELIIIEHNIWMKHREFIDALIENNKKIFSMTDNIADLYKIEAGNELTKLGELIFQSGDGKLRKIDYNGVILGNQILQKAFQHALNIVIEDMHDKNFGLDISEIQNPWNAVNRQNYVDIHTDVNIAVSVDTYKDPGNPSENKYKSYASYYTSASLNSDYIKIIDIKLGIQGSTDSRILNVSPINQTGSNLSIEISYPWGENISIVPTGINKIEKSSGGVGSNNIFKTYRLGLKSSGDILEAGLLSTSYRENFKATDYVYTYTLKYQMIKDGQMNTKSGYYQSK